MRTVFAITIAVLIVGPNFLSGGWHGLIENDDTAIAMSGLLAVSACGYCLLDYGDRLINRLSKRNNE